MRERISALRVLEGILSINIIDQHLEKGAVGADENSNAWIMRTLVVGDFNADVACVG